MKVANGSPYGATPPTATKHLDIKSAVHLLVAATFINKNYFKGYIYKSLLTNTLKMISGSELKELLKAWLAISIAFGVLLLSDKNSFGFSFAVAGLTVGLGFIAHELSHRHFARKFRKQAEFKANNMMLILAIITSFLGVVIAIPGAVIIKGFVTRKEGGIIATAGPAANLAIALIFLPLMFIIPTIAYYGMMINAWLALFNLIPFVGFDGHKIFEWNKPTYFIMLGVAIILNALQLIIQVNPVV